MYRNQWPDVTGMGGRMLPESVAEWLRNTQEHLLIFSMNTERPDDFGNKRFYRVVIRVIDFLGIIMHLQRHQNKPPAELPCQ